MPNFSDRLAWTMCWAANSKPTWPRLPEMSLAARRAVVVPAFRLRSKSPSRSFGDLPPRAERRGEVDEARRLQRLPRLHFLVPDRTGLPGLAKYATLQCGDGTRRIVGYTEASRGCRHLCRHCPVVPVYHGQFRVVQPDVVLADVAAQVAAGAEHITFGDPDFFNGPTHALRIVEALHAAHPALTYDVTIKVEHLLAAPRAPSAPARHRLPVRDERHRIAGRSRAGSAREGTYPPGLLRSRGAVPRGRADDRADLRRLSSLAEPRRLLRSPRCDRGARSGRACRADSTGDSTADPRRVPAARARGGPPSRRRLRSENTDVSMVPSRSASGPRSTRRWPPLSARSPTSDREALFDEIWAFAYQSAGLGRPAPRPVRDRATVPYLNEPWYC